MTTFDRIKKLAETRGMSLTEVAEKSDLSRNAIYKWKERSPQADKLVKVAKTLGTTVDYLLYGSTFKHVDIADDDVIMTFEGKEIPPEDIELMRRLLRGGKN